MKRSFVFATLVLCWGGFVNADNAVFKAVNGKVEYQLEGAEWKPAKPGLSIPEGSLISTGFKSTAVVNLDGSYLTVKPLTRLSIQTLAKNNTGAKVQLYLLAGKVRTEVKPAENPDDNQFTVKSPTATASVRGTGFEFDGVNLLVNHGEVVLANQYDFSRHIVGGEFASTQGTVVTAPVQVKDPEKPELTAQGGDDQNVNLGNNQEQQTSELTTALQTFGSDIFTADQTTLDKVNNAMDQALKNNSVSQNATVSVTIQ